MHFIDSNLIEQIFIPRKKESYKGDFGLTTLGTYSDCFNIFSIKLNEVMIINLDEFDILKNRKYPTILTPHYGEFSKLVSLEIDYIKVRYF